MSAFRKWKVAAAKLILLLHLPFLPVVVAAQDEYTISRSGIIKQDQIWRGTVHVTGPTTVPEGVTLTIEPGTVVRFKHGCPYEGYLSKNKRASLKIADGTLKAIGTPEKQICFTSDRKDPINEDWAGISFAYSTGNELKYVIVEYADIGIELELNSSATVSHSILRWSQAGIYQEVNCSLIIESNTFYGIGHEPFAMEQYCNAIVRNNKITNCNGAIVVADGKAEVKNNFISNNLGQGMEMIGAWGNCDVTFANNTITRNSGQYIVMVGKGAKVKLVSNEISHNKGAIACFGATEFVLNNNAIFSNRGVIDIADTSRADITKNWWGTVDRKEIANRITADQRLNFEPFLEKNPLKISLPEFDYKDISKTELGYIPGDPQDRYMRIFPREDDTRRVIKRIGKQFGYEGVGWSLCWDSKALWTFRHDNPILCRVDPDTGRILKEFTIPGINRSRGIAFDGSHLWINDFAELKVFEVDPKDGKVLSTFQVPEQIGIAQTIVWDGENLYLSGYGEPRLYKVDKKGNILGIVKLETGGSVPIAWDGSYWWTAADDGAIYKLDSSGKVAGMINAAASETWAITWGRKHLWAIQRLHERWDNVPRIFEIEILDDQVALRKWQQDQAGQAGLK